MDAKFLIGLRLAAQFVSGWRAALLLFIALSGLSGCGQSASPTQPGSYAILHGSGGDVTLKLEAAKTPASRSRGLMGRTDLAENQGMIFVWDQPVLVSFTMRNTLIPLSIAFISEGGELMETMDMQPQNPGPYTPSHAFLYAIEVNQGYFEKQGLRDGDEVEIFLEAGPQSE